MIWLLLIALAALGLISAAYLAGLPRQGYTLFAAALLFALAGYAVQGSPDLPGAPRSAVEISDAGSEAVIRARRAMFGPDLPPSRYVNLADGFARRGRYGEAADFLNLAIREQPNDAEAWVSLGNVLVEYANGTLTPAGAEAFARARAADPDSPAPPYFLGAALLRRGELADARALWAEALELSPEDADFRPELAFRLAQLDAFISASSAANGPPQ
ncbi:tetratricopeptide repeat protein [Qipengyuania atrilutea]|uniref:Cytochrome C biosynthesis protein n=1 Tax=Qipengyuania atrilutea TaxID=2744473 RepID=A0A850H0Y2_9SPHN|nr:cytochrome C biosynthesis protein [Actirhodobacter atriluteus]NVD43603.1 cytochrome C biosynthesis protein [Actirhodobacter atriluteus]